MHRVLIALSLCAFVVGLVFPVAARAINPFMAYGIVFVSWPAWAVGAAAGGIAGYRAANRPPRRSGRASWGIVLCVANVAAAVATLLLPFHAS
jgi:hypothetical protein